MMKAEPTIFESIDAEADERAIREGEAAADAGQVVSHSEVSAWLATWGTPDEKPAPGISRTPV
jgi:predicted transcriptional regulator